MSPQIDTDNQLDIMTPEEVAQFLHKSLSWVYKNSQLLGGVKLGGSLFFQSKEDLYERLFNKGQGVAVRLHAEGREAHPSLVQNQNTGPTGRSKQKKGVANSTVNQDPNRHGIRGASQS